MANYASLKNIIDQYITTNGQGEITGAILNEVLEDMVDSLGSDYQFGGFVVPSSNVGTPDQNVFYFALQAGTYTNFGNVVIPNGITIFMWNGNWSNQILFDGDGAISKKLLNNLFIGNGNTFATCPIYGLIPGNTYILYLRNNTWDVSAVTVTSVYRFAIMSVHGSTETTLKSCNIQYVPDSSYEFTVPADSDYIVIGGRANSGVEVDFLIVDITKESELSTYRLGEKRCNIFLTNRPITIEENDGLPDSYFKFDTLYVRYNSISRDVTLSDLATELGVSLTTSRKGLENCILLDNNMSLVYDLDDNTFKLVNRNNIKNSQILLISSRNGHIIDVNQGLLNAFDMEKLRPDIENLKNESRINYFKGDNNVFVYTTIDKMLPNHKYRIYPYGTWDMSSVTITGVYRFQALSVLNGATTDLFHVAVGTNLKEHYDFTTPSNFDEIRIGGRVTSNTKAWFIIEDITALIQKADLVPYFAALKVPQFLDVDLATPTLKVKFPSDGLRLYTSLGNSLIGDYTGAANQTFTLTNLQSLVWDFGTASIKVVATGTAGDYVHLLNLARNAVTGLFAGWFNQQMKIETESKISGAVNSLGEEVSASMSYNITSGMAGFSALVEVGIPYNRKFIFRVNDPDGTINKVSELRGYDYDGNNVDIAIVDLLPNTDYVYYAPKGLKSLRVWVGASFMTGTAGTITVQVTVPSQYDDESIVRRWNAADKLVIRDNLLSNADFKALFFSDIHGASKKFERIIALGNDWLSQLNCILDTGDDTANYQSNTPLSWYNTIAQTSELPIVRAVGNHDAWITMYNVWATAQQIYETFTKPAVTLMRQKGLTVVQPSDAATAYRNYYYVDFGSVRMIVILSLTGGGYYDANQNTWFESVLADAITNNKSVICANHAPMPLISSVENIKCNWCSYKTRTSDGTIMEGAPLTAVDTFMRNGGKFICWLTGHTHIDYVMKYSNTVGGVMKTQFAFTTSCAKGGVKDGVQPYNDYRNEGCDLFNMVGVDLTNHLVKVWRIGFNTNKYLQVHNTFVWDYANNKMISLY